MKIVIDIPEDTYERIKALLGTEYLKDNCEYVMSCVANGTPYEERPKGKWITKPHVHGVTYCSECDFELKIDDTNYCPNCGARMESDV